VAEQLPQADEEEAGARSDVPDEGAHGVQPRCGFCVHLRKWTAGNSG
jgi:hypothetical protein